MLLKDGSVAHILEIVKNALDHRQDEIFAEGLYFLAILVS